LYSNSSIISDQRQQDIALARSRVLDILIEELAFNTTLSFMNSNLLSPSMTTNTTITTSINTYACYSQNLLLLYGLAIFFALLANILGAFAYMRNGVSHDKSFSAILASTRDPGLMGLFHARVLGKLPLPKSVRTAKLKFGKMEEGGLGFKRA